MYNVNQKLWGTKLKRKYIWGYTNEKGRISLHYKYPLLTSAGTPAI